MGTILHGEKGEIIEAVQAMQEAIFAQGVQRLSTLLKIDERRDKEANPSQKLDSLNRYLK